MRDYIEIMRVYREFYHRENVSLVKYLSCIASLNEVGEIIYYLKIHYAYPCDYPCYYQNHDVSHGP